MHCLVLKALGLDLNVVQEVEPLEISDMMWAYQGSMVVLY